MSIGLKTSLLTIIVLLLAILAMVLLGLAGSDGEELGLRLY